MDTAQNKNSLRRSFELLPQSIKDWLTSERATTRIIEINKRMGIVGDSLSIIPRLILRLATKDLNPRDFTNEIKKGLGIDTDTAKTITQEIDQAILRPVVIPLRREVGVDINLIYPTEPSRSMNQSVLSMPPEPPAPPQQPPTPAAPPPPQAAPMRPPLPPAAAVPQAPKPPMPPSPAAFVPPAAPTAPSLPSTPKPPMPPAPLSGAEALAKAPAPPPLPPVLTRQSGPPLIQTKGAAHPEERRLPEPPPSFAKTSEGKAKEMAHPRPVEAGRGSPPIGAAEEVQNKTIPIPIKKGNSGQGLG